MTRNIGKIDRIIRIVIGIAIIIFGVATNSWLGFIGLIPLATGLYGWCGLYSILKVNTTCDKESCNKENSQKKE
jgi:hypothetical protein